MLRRSRQDQDDLPAAMILVGSVKRSGRRTTHTEYIDFHRDVPPIEAAQHSLELDNFSHRLKVNVFNAVRDA